MSKKKAPAGRAGFGHPVTPMAAAFAEVILSLHGNADFYLLVPDPVVYLQQQAHLAHLVDDYRRIVPRPMYLDNMLRRANMGEYTAGLHAAVEDGRVSGASDFQPLWATAVDTRLRADFELIYNNCVRFNETAPELVEMAGRFIAAARAKCDELRSQGAQQFAAAYGGPVKAAAGGKAAGGGKRRGRPQDDDLPTQRSVNAVSSTASTQLWAPAAAKPPAPEEAMTSEQKLERLRKQFRGCSQVSGPLALSIPAPVRLRLIEQHMRFTEACPVAGVPVLPLASAASSQQQQQQQQQPAVTASNVAAKSMQIRGYDPAAPPQRDTVLAVLRDFFAHVCAKHATSAPPAKSGSGGEEAALAEITAALRCVPAAQLVPCPAPAFYFGAPDGNAAAASTLSSRAPERVKQCWNALSKVLLPFFDEAAFKRYVYLDERGALGLLSVQTALRQEEEQPWHCILHFDVLLRCLPDAPIVAAGVLAESFRRAAANTAIVAPEPMQDGSKAAVDAALIVGSAVVPVFNDLLAFIAETRLSS